MKKSIILILLLFSSNSFSQYITEYWSRYDNVPDEISSSKSFQREKWFYEQRIFPNENIPPNAYDKAFKQKMDLLESRGYYYKDYNWFSIGPTPGINTNYGNVASRIATVKFDPSNPNIIYIGAAYGGIWKTTNGGDNWFPKTDFEVTLSSGALAIDNTNPNIIYYGTGEATYFTYSYSGKGILKSTDAGNTWVNYRSGLPDMTYFSRLVIKPGSPNTLFAALGNSGLYKSTDSGQSWSQAVSGRCDDVVFSPDGIRAYCIGQGSGYRISTNGGNSFESHSVFAVGIRNHITVCRSVPNIIYASVYQSGGVNVYKSTNSGYNFVLLPNNFTGTNQAWYDFYIHVNPYDPNNAYVGLVDLWRTTDGSTFTKITNTSAGPVHVDHHNMDFHPTDPDKLICANDGGVWYSTDKGTNWINMNSTLNLTQFYRITSDPENEYHIIGGTQDNGTQRTTGSLKWNVIIGGDGGDVCFHSKNSKYILAENQFNGVKRSEDEGITWSNAVSGLTGSAAWIAPLLSHPDSLGIFYTARRRVFKSTNLGVTWIPYSTGTSGIIREMAISGSNPSIMYAAAHDYIYRSKNGGLTFSDVTNSLPSRIITSVSIHPDSSDVALITFSGYGSGHIYKTTNSGNKWINISGDLPDVPVNDGMFYYPGYSTSVLLIASDVGVFISNDGRSWTELANGLPNTVSIHLDYNLAHKKLRVGTHGRGVWEFSGDIIGIVNRNSNIPESFMLYQNLPNPFNPSTLIKFDIPSGVKNQSSNVRLIIIDVLGREIATLVNEKLNAGSYEVNWDASGYPSGVYFSKLITDDCVDVKKMLFVK
jgi:photosystem II stability/assembly factor-like uncharacterized protein